MVAHDVEPGRGARALIALIAITSLALGACGDDIWHAQHMAQMVDHGGLHAGRLDLVTMTYPNDALGPTGVAFDAFVLRSQWLRTVADEYGVHGGAQLASYVVGHDAPTAITTSEVLADLAATVPAEQLVEPSDGGLTVFVMYLPRATTLTDDNFGALCTGFDAFHRTAMGVAYAMVPDCDGTADSRTILASHEIVEAATDPFFDGIYADGPDDDAWHYDDNSEVGDLCEFETTYAHEGGYALQRSWSQAATFGAHPDPCVPVPDGDTWADVDPDFTYIAIPAGAQTQIGLTAWASRPDAAWNLDLVINSESDFKPPASLDRIEMTDGARAAVTIGVPAGTPSGSHAHVHIYSNAAMAPIEVVVP